MDKIGEEIAQEAMRIRGEYKPLILNVTEEVKRKQRINGKSLWKNILWNNENKPDRDIKNIQD